MQVARLLEPRSERSFIAKLRQMVRAIQLERTLSKDEILALYLQPRALWRQSRRHPRRLARLFRQGAAAADARRNPRCWWRCRNRRNCAGRTVPSPPRARRATACSTGWRRPASCRPTRSSAPSRRPSPEGRRPMPMLAPHAADAVDRRRARPRHPPADHRGAAAEVARRAGARARPRARPDALGRHPRGRPRDRRGAWRASRRPTIST